MNKDNGGSAFPVPAPSGSGAGGGSNPLPGMTLRDYFAAQALVAITSGAPTWVSGSDMPELAERAYMLADAMLAERQK